MELREGIILKTIKYQENSKIAYIITKEGLVTALIRASLEYKSKNYSYSQELTKIEFDISKSKRNSFDILTSGRLIDSYLNIKKDYNTLLEISKIIDLTYKSIEHVTNCEYLYQLFVYLLDKYDQNYQKNNIKYYLLIFKVKLLYLLGVGFTTSKCSICGKNTLDFKGFSIERGGFVCNHCKSRVNDYLQGDYIKILQILYLAKLDKLNQELIDNIPLEFYSDIEMLIKNYYNRYLSISF